MLGILGTFAGVTAGLLHFDSANIQGSMPYLISGIRTAFIASLAGVFWAITIKVRYRLFGAESAETAREGATVDDLASQLTNVHQALVGNDDSTILSQLKLGRQDINDRLDALKRSQQEFMAQMAEMNSKALISALEQVMITVGELITALPQLVDDVAKVGRQSDAILVSPPGYQGYELEQALYPNNLCVATIDARFPVNAASLRAHAVVGEYLDQHNLQYDGSSKRASWTGTRDRISEIAQICVETAAGYYFLPKVRGRIISEFSISLMALYALSILVRYNPQVWIRMTEDQPDEHFLIRSFILLAKNQVPQLALNHLTRESWKFHSGD